MHRDKVTRGLSSLPAHHLAFPARATILAGGAASSEPLAWSLSGRFCRSVSIPTGGLAVDVESTGGLGDVMLEGVASLVTSLVN